jgi:hypothetical protein
MTTSARIGYGTLLKRGDGASPETFTAIAEVTNITGPNLTLNTEDATHMESPDATMEFIPALIDPGTLSFTVHFLPTNTTQTDLITDLKTRVIRNFQLVCNDPLTTTWSFAAYVTGFNLTAPIAGKFTADVTLKVTSIITSS